MNTLLFQLVYYFFFPHPSILNTRKRGWSGFIYLFALTHKITNAEECLSIFLLTYTIHLSKATEDKMGSVKFKRIL